MIAILIMFYLIITFAIPIISIATILPSIIILTVTIADMTITNAVSTNFFTPDKLYKKTAAHDPPRMTRCEASAGMTELYARLLVVAHKQTTSREILLWMTPSEAPKALQASECSELLDPTGASCWIFAQH